MRQDDRDRLLIAIGNALWSDLMPAGDAAKELKAALEQAERSNERITEPDRKGVEE